jgi:hypothetical protein
MPWIFEQLSLISEKGKLLSSLFLVKMGKSNIILSRLIGIRLQNIYDVNAKTFLFKFAKVSQQVFSIRFVSVQ